MNSAARLLCTALCGALVLAWPSLAQALPIPQTSSPPSQPFTGHAALPKPISTPAPPRHPFMAPNERSNIHNDAYQSDAYRSYGPLGRGGIKSGSAYNTGECASLTFDSRGRIVTVCVGVAGPILQMLDPVDATSLAAYLLPLRDLNSPPTQLTTNFAGGGYFYLDNRDRAVIPTTSRHIVTVAERADGRPGFSLVRDVDVSGLVHPGDGIISALPDWSGRLWFVTKRGIIGTVDARTAAVRSVNTHEPIGNSFAVDETGGVYIVTDAAMYRFDASSDGAPVMTWRERYANIGVIKPGQTERGSGTTPTLMGSRYVAITDNADPMNVVVYKRARSVSGPRGVCTQAVFSKGASNTDQSLIGTATSMIAENNYGYSGIAATQFGASTSPGLARVDLDNGGGCHTVWTSSERAPSVVPKLSLAAGLVYTYTKDPRGDGEDPWFLTALDFRTGATVFERYAGSGVGFNNNYAPITLGPDGTAYLGVLGGTVVWRDREPLPPLPHMPAAARVVVKVYPRSIRHGRRTRVSVRVVRRSGRRDTPLRGATVTLGSVSASTRSNGLATLSLRPRRVGVLRGTVRYQGKRVASFAVRVS